MNKNKRKDEIIAQEVDREIARWDPQSVEFLDLVLNEIVRDQWHPRDSTVVDTVIALLGGDLDVESKKRLLCACDESSGMTWEWHFDANKAVPEAANRAVSLEKLLDVFASQHVPYAWKRETLLLSMDRRRNYNRENGVPLIPLEYGKDSDDAPVAVRTILGINFYRPDVVDFWQPFEKIKKLEKAMPGSVSKIIDCYGNNAHIYAFCQYWSTNEVNGCENNEYWWYGTLLADELTRLGCDPDQANEFGIARNNLCYGHGYDNGKIITR